MQYTELRRRVADAIRAALPVDPDDSTLVRHFSISDGRPVWGHADTVVNVITDGVMQVLETVPAPDRQPQPEREASIYRQLGAALSAGDATPWEMAAAIAGAIETALVWAPDAAGLEQAVPADEPESLWEACQTRMDDFVNTGGLDPTHTIRITCIDHGLMGVSDPHSVRATSAMKPIKQATARLVKLHEDAGIPWR